MPIEFAQTAILFFGAFVCILSAVCAIAPAGMIHFVTSAWPHPASMVVAVAVRLVFGVLLIVAAPQSRFPLALKILGGAFIVAAIILLLLGRDRIGRLLAWFAGFPLLAVRLWCLVGILFGGFLMFAVW